VNGPVVVGRWRVAGAALLAAGLAAGCHPGSQPRATRLAAALDSLTPGLRFGDNAAAVGRKLPGFQLRTDRTFDTTLDNPWLGHSSMSLLFEGSIASALGAPPPPLAGLESVILSVPSDSQFRRTTEALTRWLGAHPDTLCTGPEERRLRVLRWQPDSAEMLVAMPPLHGVGPGYLQFSTTALSAKRLAAPRLERCEAARP